MYLRIPNILPVHRICTAWVGWLLRPSRSSRPGHTHTMEIEPEISDSTGSTNFADWDEAQMAWNH